MAIGRQLSAPATSPATRETIAADPPRYSGGAADGDIAALRKSRGRASTGAPPLFDISARAPPRSEHLPPLSCASYSRHPSAAKSPTAPGVALPTPICFIHSRGDAVQLAIRTCKDVYDAQP
eukprot:8619217-Pyramimonas_sp.AAC.1